MDTADLDALKQQRDGMARRLREFERQSAYTGLSTEPHITLQIQDLKRELRLIDNQICECLPRDARRLALATYAGGLLADPLYTAFDWSGSFPEGRPAATTWTGGLWADLRGLKQQCDQRAQTKLAVHMKAHLSVGLAFGFLFSQQTTYDLWIAAGQGQWWCTSSQPDADDRLVWDRQVLDPEQPDVSLEIWASSARNDAIDRWLVERPLPLRERHCCALEPAKVMGSAHAVAIALAIGTYIRSHLRVAQRTPRRIHLFMAAPIPLAVMIGRMLNACGPVQCYDYDKLDGTYVPACELKG
ncbi:SAVED domain-containing protein [Chloroflexia bacterium SDU3-3]|nr:SAVED domain-containing protein [Chloroflexia bacterium SDU3-3]